MVRLWPVAAGGRVTLLTPEFFAAADPQVSDDGKRILFAGQRSRGARWQIWEMSADGSGKRQVTTCEGDCLKPAYLPRRQIVFTAFFPARKLPSVVYVTEEDGSDPHPITFGPAGFQVERVLGNGRILVSAAYPLDGQDGKASSRELYTLQPDGTGLTAFRCDHKQGASRGMAEELADGSLLYVESSASGQLAGTLRRLERRAHRNATAGGSASTIRSPRQLVNGDVVVAHQAAEANSEPRQSTKFRLYTFDPARGSLERLIYADPEYHCLDPVVLAPRPAAKYFWSAVNPESKVGYLVGLQSHLASSASQAKPGQFPSRVRVVMEDKTGSGAAAAAEAPVESDGSFLMAVPADTPVRVQLLDQEGRLLHEQKSWIWVRPGERRGCLGCHADPSRVPENAIPQALLRLTDLSPVGPGSAKPDRTPPGRQRLEGAPK